MAGERRNISSAARHVGIAPCDSFFLQRQELIWQNWRAACLHGPADDSHSTPEEAGGDFRGLAGSGGTGTPYRSDAVGQGRGNAWWVAIECEAEAARLIAAPTLHVAA